MNKIIFTLIALTSFQLYTSEEFQTTAHKKQKIDYSENESALSTVIRNDLFFAHQGCIVAIREFLSEDNKTVGIRISIAILHSDTIALKNIINNNNFRLKKALLPQLARCFPEHQNHIQSYRNNQQRSMLHFACESSKIFSSAKRQAQYDAQHITILKYLIKNDIDVNAQGKDGETAMHRLMYYSYVNLDAIKILKYAGADINAQTRIGNTPLFISALNMNPAKHEEYVNLIEELILYGANINIKNNENKSVLTTLEKRYTDVHDHSKKINLICKNLGARD